MMEADYLQYSRLVVGLRCMNCGESKKDHRQGKCKTGTRRREGEPRTWMPWTDEELRKLLAKEERQSAARIAKGK